MDTTDHADVLTDKCQALAWTRWNTPPSDYRVFETMKDLEDALGI